MRCKIDEDEGGPARHKEKEQEKGKGRVHGTILCYQRYAAVVLLVMTFLTASIEPATEI